MNKARTAELLELSVSERIQLVEDIWDSIAAVPDAVPRTEPQKEELDRRLDAYHQDLDAGSPWKFVREKMQQGA
jgi:putative addiction module component (TIGR02574 family)